MTTWRGTLQYDGTDFSGWQIQPGRRTVQGVVEAALADLLGERIPILAAGRTDAGVHAAAQTVSFRAATVIPGSGLAAALNTRLPDDVAVLSIAAAPDSFHATHDARGKLYRYRILNSRSGRPLLRRTHWRVPGPLDADRMATAARHLVGTHDFRTFRSDPGDARRETQSTVRTLRRLDVTREGAVITLDAEGDGFLHHMVRNIAGTLVQVGRGTWEPDRLREALAARDRRAAGRCAPAAGLMLMRVDYD